MEVEDALVSEGLLVRRTWAGLLLLDSIVEGPKGIPRGDGQHDYVSLHYSHM